MEKWRDVRGYEGLYQVSSEGMVRSLDRYVTHSRNPDFNVLRKGKIMSPVNHGNGYLYVSLTMRGKRKNHYIHRLVAEAFVRNPNAFNEVDHKNRNRRDNRAENLRWVDHADNMANAEMGGVPRDSWKKPKSGEKYIKRSNNRWRVVIARKDFRIDKGFETIEEAVEFRNSLGKEVIGNVG